MFVADECLLDLSFRTAQERIASSAYGSLISASEGASGDGLAGLIKVGPRGAAPGLSKLVDVHVLELQTRDDFVTLRLSWEATGPGGRLFPALDAEITLTPAGEDATRLSLSGSYQPPLAVVGAGLDKALLNRVATATIRSFLRRVADAITKPDAADGGREGPAPQPPLPHLAAPGQPALRPPSGRAPRTT
jgi:hypothetical protein